MKISTVEEFLVAQGVFYKPEISNFNLVTTRDAHVFTQKNIKRAMIEFAKLHVQAALEEASENVEVNGNTPQKRIDRQSILNTYPLENIK